MARFKITKIYIVDATTRIEARNVVTSAVANNKEDEYLEFVSITETDPAKANGWGSTLKQQLTGHYSNSKL